MMHLPLDLGIVTVEFVTVGMVCVVGWLYNRRVARRGRRRG